MDKNNNSDTNKLNLANPELPTDPKDWPGAEDWDELDDNEINALIVKAFKNTKAHLGFVLDSTFAKHGSVPTAAGSHFTEKYGTEQGGLEHYLFGDLVGDRAWREVFRDGNIVIAEADISVGMATVNAVSIDDLPVSAQLRVEALGSHPTLRLVSGASLEPREAKVVTMIVELDAGKDPTSPGCRNSPGSRSWRPGFRGSRFRRVVPRGTPRSVKPAAATPCGGAAGRWWCCKH